MTLDALPRWWYLAFWLALLIVARFWLVNPIVQKLDTVITLLKAKP